MSNDVNTTWKAIVERSWADDQYRQELLDDPNRILREAGVDIPEGVNFVVVENEPARLHLVLPARPGNQLPAIDPEGPTLSQYNAAIWV